MAIPFHAIARDGKNNVSLQFSSVQFSSVGIFVCSAISFRHMQKVLQRKLVANDFTIQYNTIQYNTIIAFVERYLRSVQER